MSDFATHFPRFSASVFLKIFRFCPLLWSFHWYTPILEFFSLKSRDSAQISKSFLWLWNFFPWKVGIQPNLVKASYGFGTFFPEKLEFGPNRRQFPHSLELLCLKSLGSFQIDSNFLQNRTQNCSLAYVYTTLYLSFPFLFQIALIFERLCLTCFALGYTVGSKSKK